MLLVNLKKAPKKELTIRQIKELIRQIQYWKKIEAKRYRLMPGFQSKHIVRYEGFVTLYAQHIWDDKIDVSDENLWSTIKLFNSVEGYSHGYNWYLNLISNTVFKLKKQYVQAVVDGKLNIFDDCNYDYKERIDDFISDLKSPNSDDLDYYENIASMLKNIMFDLRLSERQRQSIGKCTNEFYESKDRLKQQAEINKKNEIAAEEAEKARVKAARAKQLAARGGNEEADTDVDENKNTKVSALEQIKSHIQEKRAARQQAKAERDTARQAKKIQKARQKEEKLKEIAYASDEQEKNGSKPFWVRAMPYAVALSFAACVSGLFVTDAANANDSGGSKENKEVKSNESVKNVENDKDTIVLTPQDFRNKFISIDYLRDNQTEQHVVEQKSEQQVVKQVAPKPVVKNNANVKSSDKFYDSRLDKLGGAKKDEVLQKIQNRMENVDLGGVSAKRVAYTYFIYSAYGYNIDVLNNFVNGAELNSDQIKELKKVIDLAKPYGTGARDLAAAHITSREIHEMCAGGDKSSAEKKIAQAKSNVKSSNDSITKSDVLKMVNNNIKCGKSGLNPDDSATLTKLLLQDNLGPDDCANMTKLLLLAGFDKNTVNQIVRQNNYSNTVVMPDNYVQRLEKQSGQKKPAWYSRCYTINRYAR